MCHVLTLLRSPSFTVFAAELFVRNATHINPISSQCSRHEILRGSRQQKLSRVTAEFKMTCGLLSNGKQHAHLSTEHQCLDANAEITNSVVTRLIQFRSMMIMFISSVDIPQEWKPSLSDTFDIGHIHELLWGSCGNPGNVLFKGTVYTVGTRLVQSQEKLLEHGRATWRQNIEIWLKKRRTLRRNGNVSRRQ